METQGSNFAGKVREYWLHPQMKIILKTFLKIDVRTQALSLIYLTLILIFYFWGTHINSVVKLLHIRNYPESLQYFIRNESYNTMSLKF